MRLQPTLILIYVAAVYRATRLIVEDRISESLREWIRRHATTVEVRATLSGEVGERRETLRSSGLWRWLFDLISCWWCISIWIAALAVLGFALWTPYSDYIALALALSGAVGWIRERS